MADRSVTRAQLNGERERDRIYQVLHSFDHRGLDEHALTSRLLSLLDLPTIADAEALHAHCAALACRRPATPASPLSPGSRSGAADEVLAHRFTFYGEAHDLPATIDFEHNPGTGHWAHDLNRFHYLFPLLAAFRESRDERYARKAVELILHWIATNDVCNAFPPGRSPYVWLSYLNIGIHLEAWSELLGALLREAPALVRPDELVRILKSIHDQVQYLDLVIPEQKNNWVTIGTRCQLATLSFWPFFRETAELATRAYERLAENAAATVTPDGVQVELTPHYHFVVIRNLMRGLEVAPLLPVATPDNLRQLTTDMLVYLRHVSAPDGMQVAFNDSDPDFGAQVESCLATPLAKELLDDHLAAPLASTCFPYAGVMTLRQGSDRGKDELYLAFDGGPFGLSHQHEDKLAFWLCAYGRSLLIDPGRHLYDTTHVSYRPYLVTTQAHSTICIDGFGQQSRDFRDQWVARAPLPLTWETAPDGTVTAGASYDLGYGPEHIPVTHRRTIVFHPDPGYWLVTDLVQGDGRHTVDSYFQFCPSTLHLGEGIAHTEFDDANLAIFFEPEEWDQATVACGEENPRAGWFSPGVNRIEPAPRLGLRVTGQLPLSFHYVLIPYRGSVPPVRGE